MRQFAGQSRGAARNDQHSSGFVIGPCELWRVDDFRVAGLADARVLALMRSTASRGSRPRRPGAGQRAAQGLRDRRELVSYQAAAGACQALLPSGGAGTTQAEVQQEWSEFRSFARCMRRHGVPNWPDPQPRSGTDPRPLFDIQPVNPQSPINPDSPQITNKLPDCDSLLKTANPDLFE